MTELPYELPAPAQSWLRESRTVLLATHENPDADGLGSLTGCGLALSRLGYEVSRLGNGPIPRPLDELPGLASLPRDDGATAYDLALVFDCRSAARLGVDAPALDRCNRVLVIDHHPPVEGEDSAGLDWVVPTAPATTLLTLSLITTLGGIETVNADIATNLYAGLVVDTGGFRHPSTTADALRAGALLIDRGARATEVTEMLLHRRRQAAVRLFSRALGEARYENEGQIVFLTVSRQLLAECGALPEEAEALISIASAIEGVALSVMHIETGDGDWRVSLRAHEPWRVDGIARANGGGGHVLASGFRKTGRLAELREGLLPELRRELESGRQRA
jgi:phosphoesterase RecJ-like protein